MLAFLELTSLFKKLKRRASLEFCVHLDMSQIGIVCYKTVSGIFNYRDFTSFSETQGFKTM